MPIPGYVQVTGPVGPSDLSDVYPTHAARFGQGGHRSASTIADRNAIPNDRREEGMTCWVTETSKKYRLLASPWAGTDTDWIEESSGGGGPTAFTVGPLLVTANVLDAVLVDSAQGVSWHLVVRNACGDRAIFHIDAVHDGTTTVDAATVTHSITGGAEVWDASPVVLNVELAGVGTAQVMRLIATVAMAAQWYVDIFRFSYTTAVEEACTAIWEFSHGWSLRKLIPTYSGPLIRVVRASDSVERDIYANPATGFIDEADLLSFIGSGNGLIQTRYDQAPTNPVNIVSNYFSPGIVVGGVIVRMTGSSLNRPAWRAYPSFTGSEATFNSYPATPNCYVGAVFVANIVETYGMSPFRLPYLYLSATGASLSGRTTPLYAVLGTATIPSSNGRLASISIKNWNVATGHASAKIRMSGVDNPSNWIDVLAWSSWPPSPATTEVDHLDATLHRHGEIVVFSGPGAHRYGEQVYEPAARAAWGVT